MTQDMLDLAAVRRAAEAVPDPELPLTVGELGLLRAVVPAPDGVGVVVRLTPTYSGCPATEVIQDGVAAAVRALGVPVRVEVALSPPWSTDWITPSGRRRLSEAGIAPPLKQAGPVPVRLGSRPPERAGLRTPPAAAPDRPECPRCGSPQTEETSRFGPTACTALWRCRACTEPFEHLRAI